jgi:uncharacterized Zn finger protein (UPF0148 family)
MSDTGCPKCGMMYIGRAGNIMSYTCGTCVVLPNNHVLQSDRCKQQAPNARPAPATPQDAPQTVTNPYARNILSCIPGDDRTLPIDVYSIGKAYPMEDAVFHAVKKCILAGLRRGDKDYSTDIREAMQSLQRELDDVAKGSS